MFTLEELEEAAASSSESEPHGTCINPIDENEDGDVTLCGAPCDAHSQLCFSCLHGY